MVIKNVVTHPALRRRDDFVMRSLCTSQWRRRSVPNEKPNDVSMKRRRGFSVVRLQDVLLEHHNDVSKGRNNDFPLVYNETPNDVSVVRYLDISKVCIHDVPLARLYDISCKFQIKQPKGLLWYVSITPRSYVFARSC